MKKLFIAFAIFAVVSVSAQNNYFGTAFMKPKTNSDSTIIFYSNKNGNEMPNALTVKPFDGMKLGNNGQGFDLYKAAPDNMIVIMPDSSFNESIPNAITNYNYPLNKISPALLKAIKEMYKDSAQSNKLNQPFKLIKPQQNKILVDTLKLNWTPIPFLR
jgi:hypothetical protein